jgi:hypothetical protein
MSAILRLILTLFTAAAVGFVLYLSFECARAWYLGVSPDPRCVYGLHGYIERHVPQPDGTWQVTCERWQEPMP